MPVYGYRCSRGHHFEVQQRITEAPLTQCPECGAPVTRVFYPVGIVFKGSGFYKTDSRGASSDGSAPSTEAAKPESKPESKSENKPSKSENKSTPKEGAA
ncbi:MAG TPA: FmdB family zinc ribbon protein [Candidatus Acidoferrum sp.]|nr:FmdB family zinc ribbon protein [Candidatus Acidoferrum sp.]